MRKRRGGRGAAGDQSAQRVAPAFGCGLRVSSTGLLPHRRLTPISSVRLNSHRPLHLLLLPRLCRRLHSFCRHSQPPRGHPTLSPSLTPHLHTLVRSWVASGCGTCSVTVAAGGVVLTSPAHPLVPLQLSGRSGRGDPATRTSALSPPPSGPPAVWGPGWTPGGVGARLAHSSLSSLVCSAPATLGTPMLSPLPGPALFVVAPVLGSQAPFLLI